MDETPRFASWKVVGLNPGTRKNFPAKSLLICICMIILLWNLNKFQEWVYGINYCICICARCTRWSWNNLTVAVFNKIWKFCSNWRIVSHRADCAADCMNSRTVAFWFMDESDWPNYNCCGCSWDRLLRRHGVTQSANLSKILLLKIFHDLCF